MDTKESSEWWRDLRIEIVPPALGNNALDIILLSAGPLGQQHRPAH